MKYFITSLLLIALLVLLFTVFNQQDDNVKQKSDEENNEQTNINLADFTGKHNIDTEKSSITWAGKGVGKEHSGTINLKSGFFEVKNNEIVQAEFTIDMTSIKDGSNIKQLETHLKSDDFFAVEKFSEAKIVATKIEKISSNQFKISAALTIKNITNPVTFFVTLESNEDNLVAKTQFSIDRTRWNIRYGSGSFFQNLGDKMIADEIDFNITLITN